MSAKRSSRPARRSDTPPTSGQPGEQILSATRELLRERRFDGLSVADILTAAGVSRASFYFYFPNKQAVLAELVRRAVAQGRQAAHPWTDGRQDPVTALRAGTQEGARLWRENAGVLMAIVENWASDPDLRALWLEQMDLFTDAAVEALINQLSRWHDRFHGDPDRRDVVIDVLADIYAPPRLRSGLDRLMVTEEAAIRPFWQEVLVLAAHRYKASKEESTS